MQVNEFKAWLEGFGEGMEGPPSEVQWKKINKKIDELDDEVTYRYYRDWYWTHPWSLPVGGDFQTLTTSTPEITWTSGTTNTYIHTKGLGGSDFYTMGLSDATSEHN